MISLILTSTRNCKLCKEIDNSLPYYDFNSRECVSKCTQITYNSICFDSCEQIGDGYVKNENNECEIKSVDSGKKSDSDSEIKNNNSYSLIKTNIMFILFNYINLN